MKKLVFLLLLPLSLFAQLPKEISPGSHVNDYDGILSHDQAGSLSEKIFFIERTYNVQIRIVLVKALNGSTVEDVARNIGNTWNVGHNGIVYLASLEDHKQRVDLADQMQQRISADQAKEMLDAVRAHFKSGHYYEGLYAMLSVLQTSLQGVGSTKEDADTLWYGLWSLAGMILIVVLLTMYIRKKRRDKDITKYYSPELSTDSDHTPYPHRVQRLRSETTTQYDIQPDNALTNLIIAEEILNSNNSSAVDNGYGTSGSSSSNDYSSSSDSSFSSSSDYSSPSPDYSSSGPDNSSSYDPGPSSGFDGGGGSTGDF